MSSQSTPLQSVPSQSVPSQQVSSLTPVTTPSDPSKTTHVSHFVLDNGMQVVVIPDHRAPVATHMVWYRNGSADDPPGKSGIAHFLEHLMFKGTKTYPFPVFSNTVSELGGQENAFTFYDFTAYFQRVATEHLPRMMEFEADRMTGLVLSEEVVAPERDVVLEERRMRTDSDPAAQLDEAMQSTVFGQHPYGKPVIGWEHEIESFGPDDALAYYRRFYTPENAILVVAGDVEEAEVKRLAEATYGRIPARGKAPERYRPREPEPRTRKLLELADEKVQQPTCQRAYLVPSYASGDPATAATMEVLATLLAQGNTSFLYQRLVMESRVAVQVATYYLGQSLNDTRFYLTAVPAQTVTLEALDKAVDEALEAFVNGGLDEDDFIRAKTRLIAASVYARDSQVSLAQWYGASLTTGLTVEDVQAWPERIEAVTAEAVRKAARRYLARHRAVTGFLMPAQAPAEAA